MCVPCASELKSEKLCSAELNCVSDWHTSNSRCFPNTIFASLFYRHPHRCRRSPPLFFVSFSFLDARMHSGAVKNTWRVALLFMRHFSLNGVDGMWRDVCVCEWVSGFPIVLTAKQTLACSFTLRHSNPEYMRCQSCLLLAVACATSEFGWRGVFDRGPQSHRVMSMKVRKINKLQANTGERGKCTYVCVVHGGGASVPCRRSALHPMAECNKTDSAGLLCSCIAVDEALTLYFIWIKAYYLNGSVPAPCTFWLLVCV